MRKSSIFLLASMGWALTACAGWHVREAPKPISAATPGAINIASVPGDPNTIICARDEVTGSRLEGRRECHTRQEWAQIKAGDYDKMQMLRAPGLSPTQQAGGK